MIQWDLCVIGASGRWDLLAPAGLSNTANTEALQKSVASLEMSVLSTQCTSSQKNKAGIIIPLTMLSELWEKNAATNEYCLLLKHHESSCARSAVAAGTS